MLAESCSHPAQIGDFEAVCCFTFKSLDLPRRWRPVGFGICRVRIRVILEVKAKGDFRG